MWGLAFKIFWQSCSIFKNKSCYLWSHFWGPGFWVLPKKLGLRSLDTFDDFEVLGSTLRIPNCRHYLTVWGSWIPFLVCYWKRVQISKERGKILEKGLLFEKWFVGVYTLTHFCIILQVMSVSVLLYHHRTMFCNWMKDLLNTHQLQRKTVKWNRGWTFTKWLQEKNSQSQKENISSQFFDWIRIRWWKRKDFKPRWIYLWLRWGSRQCFGDATINIWSFV